MNKFCLEQGHVWRALAAHLNLSTLGCPHENRISENGIYYDCTYRLFMWYQKKKKDIMPTFCPFFVKLQ